MLRPLLANVGHFPLPDLPHSCSACRWKILAGQAQRNSNGRPLQTAHGHFRVLIVGWFTSAKKEPD